MCLREKRNLLSDMEKSAEKATGLSSDIIRALLPKHRNFYLQNRKKIDIKKASDVGVEFIVKDLKLQRKIYEVCYGIKDAEGSEFGMVFTEKELDNYLDAIGFQPNLDQRYKVN